MSERRPIVRISGKQRQLPSGDKLPTDAMAPVQVIDKGSVSNTTVTFNAGGGSTVQAYTAAGSTVTWAFTNWPTSGKLGEMLIVATNMGAYTHSISGITWIKPDGTETNSIATYLSSIHGRSALQTSGRDQLYLWTRDGGTTIYGKLI